MDVFDYLLILILVSFVVPGKPIRASRVVVNYFNKIIKTEEMSKMKKIIIFLSLILIAGCSNGKRVNTVEPLKSVDKLDIQRYMGVWYELGRYPNSFEKV